MKLKRVGLVLVCWVLCAALAACGGGGGSDASSAPATVEITTQAVLLTSAGQAKALSARVLDGNGREVTGTVTWESSQPGQISVSSSGVVTALGSGGSSQIVARVGSLQSAPLLVFYSQVAAGTVLLTDAQIVGDPMETDPAATPSINNTYSVRLSGVAAPAVGQLLLNTETKIVAGRVRAVSTDAQGVHTVTLGLVSLREALPTLRIQEKIDLTNAVATVPDSVLANYTVTREGTRYTFTPKSTTVSSLRPGVSAQGVRRLGASGTSALPPFSSCETTLEGASGAGSLPILLTKTPSFTLEFKPALDIVHTPENGLERLVLSTQPTVTTDVSLEFTAGFDAKLTCGIELLVLRVPTPGPVAAFLSGLITLGAGVELSGKVELAGTKFGAVTQRATTLDVGLACPGGGSCSMVTDVGTGTVTSKATLTGPDLGQLRVQPSLFAYGKAQASIGNPFFSSLRFNAFYAKLGGALQTNLASKEGQIADAAYKSSYDVSAVLKAGLDTDFQGLAAWLGLNGMAENLVEKKAALAESPSGTVAVDRTSFHAGDRVETTVTFTGGTTFLGGYNIDEVILMRKVGANAAVEVARGTAGDGRDQMILSFVPTTDGSAAELYAFVTTRALPFMPLEVGQGAGAAPTTDQIATGKDHTCAITSAGGVKCWGANYYGQLGNGTITDSSTPNTTPVAVQGLSSGVVAIHAGRHHTCAITSAGALKCWGYNTAGQLGHGVEVASSSTPVDVVGMTSGVVAVSGGAMHTCAVTNAGAVKCWGYNNEGQLGNGTTLSRNTPATVSGLASGMVAVSAGQDHSCAVSSAGGVKCWGRNDFGALGTGNTTSSNTPVSIASLSSGVADVRAGTYHTCALTTAGSVKCWGINGLGLLGAGPSDGSSSPLDVGLSNIVDISVNDLHTCVVTRLGAAKCWGVNWTGQLGDGSTTERSSPVDVVGLSSGVTSIRAGAAHTCALTRTAGMNCWGNNSYGQLGDGSSSFSGTPTPVSVVGLP